MKRGSMPTMVAVMGSLLMAGTANAQHIHRGDIYRGSSMLVQYVEVSEIFCSGLGACTVPIETDMETGYTQAEVILTGWYGFFTPATQTYPADEIHIEVGRTTYNSNTGLLKWYVTGNLSESSAQATGFSFGVYATIILYHQSGTRLARQWTGCYGDTGSVCNDFSSFSFGTLTIPFQTMAMRGFKVTATGGQPMNLERLMVDVSQYGANGTAVSGTTSCGMMGDVLQGMDCEVHRVPIASADAIVSTLPWGPKRSIMPLYEYHDSGWPPGSLGFFLGLRSFDLSFPFHRSATLHHAAGCFAPSAPGLFTGADREWQWFGDLSDEPYTRHTEFEVTNQCDEVDLF